MGRGGTDTNAVDFFSDGSGSGNCYPGNVSSTFEPSPTSSDAVLYPSCPAPAGTGGVGTSTGDTDSFGRARRLRAVGSPPETQECSWTEHAHPPFEDFKPLERRARGRRA